MYKDDLLARPEDKIGTARQVPLVEAIAVAERIDEFADEQLGT